MSNTTTPETRSFETEVSQLLHLVVHSLYGNKEIFLRELVSNASDAGDKLRFEALSDSALFETDPELKIRVSYDKDARTIRFDDKSYQTEGPNGGGKRVSPFGFFVLPRTELPIVLQQNVQSLIGEPPQWQERARL